MKPKTLNLQEMWNLYGDLQVGVHPEEYLIDEIFEMLDRISKENFLRSLLLMYPKMVFTQHNPVEMATLFIAGLKHNEFFTFADMVQGLKRGNPKQ